MSSAPMSSPTPSPADAAASVNPEEIARFNALGAQWWDEWGPMRGLHKMNPLRVSYIADLLKAELGLPGAPAERPLEGLRLIDIGCGAGILSEALARKGAAVTGVDPGAENIAIARAHAAQSGLAIDYRATTAEALVAAGETFDAVLALEVVEHVVERAEFLATIARLVRPGGFLIASTLNRTLRSLALAKIGAEYIFRWVQPGTHDWRMFVTPEELARDLRAAGLSIYDKTGMVYHPVFDEWRLSRDCAINYLMAAEKAA